MSTQESSAAKMLVVGIADLKAAGNPCKLVTIGLGSCVGVALYDAAAHLGALAHIMLPSSQEVAHNENKAKFADTAIPLVLEKLEELGARRGRVVAKIAGGARMFSFNSAQQYVGDRNVEAVKEALKSAGVPLIASDVGGSVGRSVEFDVSTGKVYVKTITRGVTEL